MALYDWSVPPPCPQGDACGHTASQHAWEAGYADACLPLPCPSTPGEPCGHTQAEYTPWNTGFADAFNRADERWNCYATEAEREAYRYGYNAGRLG